jgi:hypothetical protein
MHVVMYTCEMIGELHNRARIGGHRDPGQARTGVVGSARGALRHPCCGPRSRLLARSRRRLGSGAASDRAAVDRPRDLRRNAIETRDHDRRQRSQLRPLRDRRTRSKPQLHAGRPSRMPNELRRQAGLRRRHPALLGRQIGQATLGPRPIPATPRRTRLHRTHPPAVGKRPNPIPLRLVLQKDHLKLRKGDYVQLVWNHLGTGVHVAYGPDGVKG